MYKPVLLLNHKFSECDKNGPKSGLSDSYTAFDIHSFSKCDQSRVKIGLLDSYTVHRN